MTNDEKLQTLREHQAWRMGGDGPMTDPKDLTAALEYAIVCCEAIPGSVNVQGSDDAETKERNLMAFARGEIRVIITKPKIAGFGLNWQHCHQQAFVGVNDSFESYYQSVRRSWRFGQTQPVDIHLFVSESEGSVLANLKRKEADAKAMGDELVIYTKDAVVNELKGLTRQTNDYAPEKPLSIPSWL